MIIPAYNNPDDLNRLLQSIVRSLKPGVEVCVIDDGSDPTLKPVVIAYGFSYHYQEHRGPSAARNYGATVANGKFIFFLDSDTMVLPDTLTKILDVIKYPGFQIGSIPYHPKSLNKGFAPEFKGFFDAYGGWYKYPLGCAEALNCSSLFRKDIFFQTKGWDESFKDPGMEHEEFSFRIHKKYLITSCQDIFVYHRSSSFIKLISKIFLRSMSWARLKMKNKVEFDATRTRTQAAIALMPLIILGIALGGVFNHLLFWLLIPLMLFYIACNIPFYRFLLDYGGFPKLLVYTLIHFIFLFSVGCGSLTGALTFWKLK